MMNAEMRQFIPENAASHLTERSSSAYARNRGNSMATEAGVITGIYTESSPKKQENKEPKKEGKKEAIAVANRRKAAIEMGKLLAKTKQKLRPEVVRDRIVSGATVDNWSPKPEDLQQKNDKYDEKSLRHNWDNFLKNDKRVDAKAIDRLIADGVPPEDTIVLDGAYLSENDVRTIRAFWEGVYGEQSEITPTDRQIITTHIAHGRSPEQAVQESIEETLRQQWEHELGSAWNNPDTRSTVQTAIQMGYSPDTLTSKEGTGLPEVTAAEVLRNALIPDNETRLEEAEKHLKKAKLLEEHEKLTEEQKQAIIKAHEYGIEEDPETGEKKMTLKGKNGKKAGAGVFNYDDKALGAKTVFMKDDLTPPQRRVLTEAGIVGAATSSDLPDFDPDSFTDPLVASNARDLHRRLESGNQADERSLENFAQELRSLKNRPGGGVNPGEIDRLLDDVESLRQSVLQKDREEQRIAHAQAENAQRREQNSTSEQTRLADEVARYNETLRENPEARDIAHEQALVAQIKKEIRKPGIPPVDAREFPDAILRAAGGFRETREMLISQIIFKAYEDSTERNEYRGTIDLYAQDSLKKLLSSARMDPTAQDQTQYQNLLGLETSAELFHTMNARILAGTLEEFTRTAERIDPKHFTLMNNLRGVGQVMRLYEQKYTEALAKDGVIYDYDAVKKEVEIAFKKMAAAGFVKTEYDTRTDINENPSTKLEDWEIERALNVGRNFSNITFRAGEYIALGEPSNSKIPFNIRFGSGPQESTVKLLNHLQWVADRFLVGDARGGAEFYALVKKRFHENNMQDQIGWNRKKLGRNKIKKFGGRTVADMELAEFFGTRSFYSSWRLQNMSFSRIKTGLMDDQGNQMTLKDWIDVHGKTIKEIKEPVEPDGHGHVHHDHMSHAQHEMVSEFRQLIANLDTGLGVLLANSTLAGEPGYLVRQMIWEKVARTNTPLMIGYLQGLEMDGVDVKSLEQLLASTPGGWDHLVPEVERDSHGNPIYDNDGRPVTRDMTKFDKFKEKVLLRHQKAVLQASGAEGAEDIVVEELTPEEQVLQARITEEGVKLAPHLADVLFAYTPFMNDVHFEAFDYEGPGQEAYKRLVGDYGQYSQAQHGYDALQDHIAGSAKPDDLVGAIKKMEGGMSGPPGPKEGMTRSVPVVEAVIDFYEAGRDTGDDKEKMMKEPNWFKKQLLYRLIRESMEKPNSLSQKFGSVLTENMDEGAARLFLEKMNKVGVINHAQMMKIRKKKKLSFGWLWAAILRDIFPLVVIAGVREFVEESAEGVPGIGQGVGGGGGHGH